MFIHMSTQFIYTYVYTCLYIRPYTCLHTCLHTANADAMHAHTPSPTHQQKDGDLEIAGEQQEGDIGARMSDLETDDPNIDRYMLS